MKIVLDGNYSADESVVVLGMFDGVHIGHRVLLQKGKALAKQFRCPLVVSTFMEHPLSVIAPEKCPSMLTTFEERTDLMEQFGVDVFYAMPFDRQVMDMPPEDYVGHLVQQFHPKAVVCGYNHTFGRKGQGSAALLNALGAALGFYTAIVPQIMLEGSEVSSTQVRRSLKEGKVRMAAKLLGRPYVRYASVQEQNGRMHLLISKPNGKQDIPEGVYRALCSSGNHRYPTVLRVDSDGLYHCMLPQDTAIRSEWKIEFLAEKQ